MSGFSILLDPTGPDLPLSLRAELKAYLRSQLDADGDGALTLPATAPSSNSTGVTDLTDEEAIRFLENCSPKTISVLKQIVARDGNFLLTDIAAAMRVRHGELGGVWGGITKRTRTITKEKNAALVDWRWVGGKWQGRISEATAAALAKALKDY